MQAYTYDDLNRLTTATGNFVGRNDDGVGFNHSKYTLAMSYDSQHNITSKIQMHETATSTSAASVAGPWTQVEQTSYNLNYQDYNTGNKNVAGYSYGQPHAPRTIVDQPNLANCCDADNDPRVKTKKFDYDRNGNQTKTSSKICTSPTPDVLRENLWDEENRLRAIDLNPEANTVHPIAIYTYDAGGERIVKQNATSVAIYENALQVGTDIKNDFMLYPSGMLVARPAADGTGALSYTKHYFAGSQRVSSKIGTTTNLGKFLQEWTLIENSSGEAPINLVSTSHDQLTKAETGVTHVYTQFGITPAPTFNSNNAFLPVPAFTGTAAETEAFWFHPDHLGSSNYITNFVGEVSQHMEYFAFGETFVEEHKNSNNSPYKFNGKELDEESGYTYFGARYLDMRYSIWISVDPLSEKYPGLSTYVYCANNPINNIDPDGRRIKPWSDWTKAGSQKFKNLFFNSWYNTTNSNDDDLNGYSCSMCCLNSFQSNLSLLYSEHVYKDGKGGFSKLSSYDKMLTQVGKIGRRGDREIAKPTLNGKRLTSKDVASIKDKNFNTGIVDNLLDQLDGNTGTYVFGVGIANGYHSVVVVAFNDGQKVTDANGKVLTATAKNPIFVFLDDGEAKGEGAGARVFNSQQLESKFKEFYRGAANWYKGKDLDIDARIDNLEYEKKK